MKSFTILIFLTALLACKNPKQDVDILDSITALQTQIEEMIQPRQCATAAGDCRIRDIMHGGSCGPTYIYNIKDVDSVKLVEKFFELEKLQMDYYQKGENLAACYRIVPNSVYIKDCKCEGEFKSDQ